MEHFEISVPEKKLEGNPQNLQITENNISNNNMSTLLKRKRQQLIYNFKISQQQYFASPVLYQSKATSHQSTHRSTLDQLIHWWIHQSRPLDNNSNPLSSFTPVYLYNSILQTLLDSGKYIKQNPKQFNMASMSSNGWNTPTL